MCSNSGSGRGNHAIAAPGVLATVHQGLNNTDDGDYSAVGGGWNEASGEGATVPGGMNNRAAESFSFAAGRRAKAIATGSFVLADSTDQVICAQGIDAFLGRFRGGVRFVTKTDPVSGTPVAGAALAGNGGQDWSHISNLDSKENLKDVDARDVLEKVAAMPIQTWNYKSQDDSVRHIGPMAEDFREAFGVGDFPDRITGVDGDGVALAAIQGLNLKLREEVSQKEAAIAAVREQNASLAEQLAVVLKQNAALEKRLTVLEQAAAKEGKEK